MKPLKGINKIITPIPAKDATPSWLYKRNKAITICTGADQSMLKITTKSTTRWASTAIRLTISPVVKPLRPELESFRD